NNLTNQQLNCHFTTNTWKVPGIILRLVLGGAFGSGSSKSAVGKNKVWESLSIAMVLAPRLVGMVCFTLNSVAEISLMTVILPSPFEVNIIFVLLSNAMPSQPSPIGTLSTTFPFVTSMTTSNLSHAANNLFVVLS